MGRRKIEMTIVKDSSSRQVTFSKRRTGLFKKANELATLCAVQVAILVFSPGGKPFSFGNPSVESVTQRFLNEGARPRAAGLRPSAAARAAGSVRRLSEQLKNMLKQLEMEKEKGQMLDKELKASGAEKYLKPASKLSNDELVDRKRRLEEARENLDMYLSEIQASSTLLLLSRDGVKKTHQMTDQK